MKKYFRTKKLAVVAGKRFVAARGYGFGTRGGHIPRSLIRIIPIRVAFGPASGKYTVIAKRKIRK